MERQNQQLRDLVARQKEFINGINTDYAKSVGEVNELQGERDKLNAIIRDRDGEITRLKRALAGAGNDGRLLEDYRTLHANFLILKRENAALEEQEKRLRDTITQLQSENGGLCGELSQHQLAKMTQHDATKRRGELEQENAKLRDRLLEFQDVGKDFSRLKSDLDGTKFRLDETLERQKAIAAENRQLQAHIESIEPELQELRAAKAQFNSRIQGYENEKMQMASAIETLKDHLRGWKAAHARLEAQLERQTSAASDARVMQAMQEKCDRLQERLEAAEAQLRNLPEMQNQFAEMEASCEAYNKLIDEHEEKHARVLADNQRLHRENQELNAKLQEFETTRAPPISRAGAGFLGRLSSGFNTLTGAALGESREDSNRQDPPMGGGILAGDASDEPLLFETGRRARLDEPMEDSLSEFAPPPPQRDALDAREEGGEEPRQIGEGGEDIGMRIRAPATRYRFVVGGGQEDSGPARTLRSRSADARGVERRRARSRSRPATPEPAPVDTRQKEPVSARTTRSGARAAGAPGSRQASPEPGPVDTSQQGTVSAMRTRFDAKAAGASGSRPASPGPERTYARQWLLDLEGGDFENKLLQISPALATYCCKKNISATKTLIKRLRLTDEFELDPAKVRWRQFTGDQSAMGKKLDAFLESNGKRGQLKLTLNSNFKNLVQECYEAQGKPVRNEDIQHELEQHLMMTTYVWVPEIRHFFQHYEEDC